MMSSRSPQVAPVDQADRIRVLLGAMPEILRRIVRDVVAAQGDIEVVGEASSRDDARAMICTTGADVVIVALRDDEPVDFYRDFGVVHVIGIAPDAGDTLVCYRNPSAHDLRDAIRAVVRTGTETPSN